MSARIIALFNNRGGVGTASLAYHLAWMYADMGERVVAADLDPQANLTAAFLDDDRLEELWRDDDRPRTVCRCIQPLLKGTGDVVEPAAEEVDANLSLVAGDLALSSFEDQFSSEWRRCVDGEERSFRVVSAFWCILRMTAEQRAATLVLMDLGPNLGAINRGALIAADHVVVPLSPDLFSLQGLRNLGPTLRRWRKEWADRKKKIEPADLQIPDGEMRPAGYVVLQHAVRLDRPVGACARWMERIPREYRESVLDEPAKDAPSVESDPHCLALLKHYRSLMPLAQEARKPIFHVKPADGAIGAHLQAVNDAHLRFRELAQKILTQTGAPLS